MGANWDKTDLGPALKEYYLDEKVRDACYTDLFLMKTLKKTKVEGKTVNKPLKIGRNLGFGATVTAANANASSATFEDWVIPEKKFYQTVYVDGASLEAAQSAGKGAWFNVVTEAIDDARKEMAKELEIKLFGNTNASRGKVKAVSGTALTLVNAADAAFFEKGMKLRVADTETGTLRTGEAAITSIDRANGILYHSAGWTTTISALVVGDFIFRSDEKTAGLNGLLAHTPVTRTGSVTVQGIDLSTDWTRLGGIYVAGGNRGTHQTLLEGCGLGKREGSQPKRIVVSANRYIELVNELGNNKMYVNTTSADVGFDKIKIVTPLGALEVVGATFCPDDYGWAIPDDLQILHWGPDVMFVADRGGVQLNLDQSADRYYLRMHSYCDLYVPQPKDLILFHFTG